MNIRYLKKTLKLPYVWLKRMLYTVTSISDMKRIMDRQIRNDNIKVGFLVQMPEIWDKQLPVFERMLNDERFDPYLVVLPSFDISSNSFKKYGEELGFFKEKYDESRIIITYTNNQWLDLKQLNFNYVFYGRCWENYLPPCYCTRNVIKYAKTCYIPYCFHGLNERQRYYKTSFFYYLYLFLCCSDEQLNDFRAHKGQKNVFLGFPSLEHISCDTELKYETILWTPRWTDDKEFGGSNFFKYMNSITDIKETFPKTNLVLRPHPLTFQNALKLGKLTETEIEEYKNKLDKFGVSFDTNKLIEDSFLKTDILITDFSSVLMPYFLTGKPIIYCSEIDNVDFTESFKNIIECSYVAKSWQDVMKYVSSLLNGEDPLKEKRIKMVSKMAGHNEESTKRILDFLIEDSKLN